MRLRHARSQSDCRRPVSSLLVLSLVCYSVAMVLDTFVLGSTIRVDTHSLRAEVGSHAVVYSVDSKQPNNKAAVWIMPDEEAASKLVAHVLAVDNGGSEGDENVLSDPEIAALDCVSKLLNQSKGSFSAAFSSNWRNLFTDSAHRPPPDPLIVKQFDLVGQIISTSRHRARSGAGALGAWLVGSSLVTPGGVTASAMQQSTTSRWEHRYGPV